MKELKNKVMKNIFNKTFLLAVTLSLVACFDLEKTDPNQQNEDTFWTNQDQLEMGIYACYDVLQIYWRDVAQWLYCGLSDEGTNEYPYEFYDVFRFRGDDLNRFHDSWIVMYNMIGRAYQVIERAPDISGAKVPQITAEARFFVALGYYHLQLVFGDHVAYVDGIQSPADRPPRAEEGQLYEMMEEQLELAIPDLPLASEYRDTDYGRITKGAAQAMLAKVHMQQGEYSEAEILLSQVIGSNEYVLLDDFEDNFLNLNEINSEAILTTNFVTYGTEGNEANDWNLRPMFFSMVESNGAFGDVQATNFILESFQTENDADGNPDPRLDATIFHENSSRLYYGEPWDFWYAEVPNPEIVSGFYKYSEQEIVATNDGQLIDQMAGTNFNLIRYADVLLLYAEALNANGSTGEAYDYVDEVRERSNMNPLSVVKPGLSQSEFLEQLKHERLVELAGELVRFDDLKRWGDYSSSNTNDPNFETFTDGKNDVGPIPQTELDLNPNLIQNPNY
jgi:tetratricopeptide (TPR) repeat protein